MDDGITRQLTFDRINVENEWNEDKNHFRPGDRHDGLHRSYKVIGKCSSRKVLSQRCVLSCLTMKWNRSTTKTFITGKKMTKEMEVYGWGLLAQTFLARRQSWRQSSSSLFPIFCRERAHRKVLPERAPPLLFHCESLRAEREQRARGIDTKTSLFSVFSRTYRLPSHSTENASFFLFFSVSPSNHMMLFILKMRSGRKE